MTFGIVDEASGDPSSASATATFAKLGAPVTSVLVTATSRQRIDEQALVASGTFELSAGSSYPIDAEHCQAEQSTSHLIATQPSGPKAGSKPPVNDAPAGAIRLASGDKLNAQNASASPAAEVPIETCPEGPRDNMGRTLWYTVLGTGQPITIDTAGSDIDTLIGLYQQDGDTFTEIGCIDDVVAVPVGGSYQAALTFDTVAGDVYYAQIGGFMRPFSDVAEVGRIRVAVR